MKISVKIFANLIGRIWAAGIGIICVPFYIKFLGIESYGLIGFYGTILGAMFLLDFGLTLTLNRELTKATVNKTAPEKIRNMVFTIECIYWLIGVLIAAIVISLAPFIASHWIKAEHLHAGIVKNAIVLMGVVIAFQWPISLYNGGLLGLEKQVIDNVIMVIMTTIRSVGVILLLWLVTPSVKLFFIWQATISLLYVITIRSTLWYYLPKSYSKVKFSKIELKKIYRFAAGMTSISIVSFFSNQIDKLILSKMLPLSQFAYYMLAFSVVNGITILVTSVNTNFFPRLTTAITATNLDELKLVYHKACHMVASIVFPIGLIIIFFSKEVLFVWTKNQVTTNATSSIMQILVAGIIMGNLMGIPYLLVLAKGQTKFAFYQSLIAAVISLPLLFLLVKLFGAIGAAFVYLGLNMGYFLICVPIITMKFLSGEFKRWLLKDTLLPLLPSLIVIIILKFIFVRYLNHLYANIITLSFFSIITIVSSLIFLPESIQWFKKYTHKVL